MHIWVDADACPKVIKEIIFKACLRTNTSVTMVANSYLVLPAHPLINSIKVSKGFDMADEKIVEQLSLGDLVITADIPLADAAIQKGAIAINPRGSIYTKENIKDMLLTRNLLSELRDFGVINSGNNEKPFVPKEKQSFANKLDSLLAKAK